MKIAFISQANETLASFRYRVKIPAAQLSARGHRVDILAEPEPGYGVAVFGKHDPHDALRVQKCRQHAIKAVYDICDNHFANPPLGAHYRLMAAAADLVTCPTPTMAEAVANATGRQATVIADPYEMPGREPRKLDGKRPRLLWFGHPSNLPSLTAERGAIGNHPITVITAPVPGYHHAITPWSPEAVARGMRDSDIAIIPVADTPRSRCKSANRLVEAIRCGLFVAAHAAPQHEEFRYYAFIGDIGEGVAWAARNPGEALARTRAGQDYIRANYSPERIGGLWETALSGLI